MNPGAFLTDQDISCPYRLPREPLDTHALSRTVSAITGTSPCFLMCHNTLPKTEIPITKSQIPNNSQLSNVQTTKNEKFFLSFSVSVIETLVLV
jgi:hypothetical protein